MKKYNGKLIKLQNTYVRKIKNKIVKWQKDIKEIKKTKKTKKTKKNKHERHHRRQKIKNKPKSKTRSEN